MRYAYAITGAMLLGGAAATVALQTPLGAQVAQNAPSQMAAVAPRGAPMSFADLAAKLQPAVVNISTTQKVQVQRQANPFAGTPFGDFFRRFGGGHPGMGGGDDDNGDNGGGNGVGGGSPATRDAVSLGSGFIVSADGYIVTNNHVISGVPTEQGGKVTISSVTVTLPNRKEYKATIVGKDPASDLAVLKIDATNLPFVQFGDSTRTRVGDWVLAIGNPFALGGTVTAGIVSAIHRSIGSGPFDRYIQTDAAINQGNSGGPMFDLNGNVVGINSAIYSPSGGNVGIGFAIPAEEAKPVVMQLMKGQRIHRGYLGVGVQVIDDDIAAGLNLPKDRGAIVSRVEPTGPAARAGVQQGDVIVRVAGQEVTPDASLSYIVSSQSVGSRVPIEVIRNGRRLTLTATLADRPSEEALAGGDEDQDNGAGAPNAPAPQTLRSALGVSLQTLTPTIAQQIGVPPTVRGVVITNVDQSSDAASKGLQQRDVILAIGQTRVATTAEAAAAVDAAKRAGAKTVLLLVQRGGRPALYLGVDLASGK